MSTAGGMRGLKSYLATLVATVLFPLLWLRALRMARKHADDDARGRAKVVVAIGVSVLIAAGGFVTISGFLTGAEEGMYKTLDGRIQIAVGQKAYADATDAIKSADGTIPIIQANLVSANAALGNATAANQTAPSAEHAENVTKAKAAVTKLELALKDTQTARSEAQATKALLEPNHAQYLKVAPVLAAQDDAEAKALIAAGPAYAGRDEAAAAAFAKKDTSMDDMTMFAWLFLWPSLAGAFFAPLAFALGSILRKSFEPSDTVGFKPYPGAAAGFFLLLGAFGLPSILFAAWTFNDAFQRSEEGQIAL